MRCKYFAQVYEILTKMLPEFNIQQTVALHRKTMALPFFQNRASKMHVKHCCTGFGKTTGFILDLMMQFISPDDNPGLKGSFQHVRYLRHYDIINFSYITELRHDASECKKDYCGQNL